MSITAQQATTLDRLGFSNAPVAVAFLPDPPGGLDRIDRAQAAGCGYWKEASEGRAFYTAADDHVNCPVGAFTHGVPLTGEQGAQLQALVGTMIELKYLRSEEIPQLPHRTAPMRFAAYAPLAGASFPADVVIFRGNVRQIMLVSEAARAAGVFEAGAVMGRPACAMIPQALDAAAGVASVGCIGTRVYTGLGDDEMYMTVPGSAVERVLTELETTLAANTALEQFHQQRLGASGSVNRVFG
jgi:uncharacterized protein (DUF169 family)